MHAHPTSSLIFLQNKEMSVNIKSSPRSKLHSGERGTSLNNEEGEKSSFYLSSSNLSGIIREAKASLSRPSRPITSMGNHHHSSHRVMSSSVSEMGHSYPIHYLHHPSPPSSSKPVTPPGSRPEQPGGRGGRRRLLRDASNNNALEMMIKKPTLSIRLEPLQVKKNVTPPSSSSPPNNQEMSLTYTNHEEEGDLKLTENLDQLDLGFSNNVDVEDDGWNTLMKMLEKLLTVSSSLTQAPQTESPSSSFVTLNDQSPNGDALSEVIAHLKDLNWLRNRKSSSTSSGRPSSSSTAASNTSETNHMSISEKRKRLISWLNSWMEESQESLEIAVPLLLRITSSKCVNGLLEESLKSLFHYRISQGIEHNQRSNMVQDEFMVGSLVYFINRQCKGLSSSQSLLGKERKDDEESSRMKCLIYSCGILRNFCDSFTSIDEGIANMETMIKFDGIEALSQLATKLVYETTTTNPTDSTISSSDLVLFSRMASQIIPIFRTLYDNAQKTLQTEIPLHIFTNDLQYSLYTILLPSNLLHDDPHVILMLCKLLCSLSEDPTTHKDLMHPEYIDALHSLYTRFLQTETKYHDIITRTTYVLANLSTNHHPEALHGYMSKKEDLLTEFMIVYSRVSEQFLDSLDSEWSSNVNVDVKIQGDLTLKMTRYLGNMALEGKIGEFMVERDELEIIFKILEKSMVRQVNSDREDTSDDGESEEEDEFEEMRLNIIGCLANLSFYAKPNTRLFQSLYDHLTSLFPLLMSENEEEVYETCRIVGNISRFTPPVSISDSAFPTHLVSNVIYMLLDHQDTGILENCCGILLNLSKTNAAISKLFIKLGAVEKLLDVLEWSLSIKDLQLSCVAAHAIHYVRSQMASLDDDIEERIELLLAPSTPSEVKEILMIRI